MSSSFWEFLWLIVWTFFLLAYLLVLFQIIVDLFGDHTLNGWWKAVWIIALIVVPLLSSLVYIIARGGGMARRQAERARRMQADTDEYIRGVAGTSPADQIARASALYKDGTITEAEFNALKAKALS